ncbi:CD1375 family protein [Paenibacillus campi]|nr:CD1375 family protein [Paenibacillus sp. SGZ-1009]
MNSLNMKFAEAYWVLVQAGRRTEEAVPEELRSEYEAIKNAAAVPGSTQ